jgi:hypothetical protein
VDVAGNQGGTQTQTYAVNPILLVRTNQTYTSLQEAYNTAIESDIIKVQGTYLVQSLNANRNISVTLDGGYNNNFTTKSGFTTLKGTVQTFTGGGTLTLKNFVLTP